jgi:hypothetical protein
MDDINYDNISPKDPVEFDREEVELVSALTNNKIQNVLTRYGYPEDKLRTIFSGQKCSSKEQCELNWALKSIKKVDFIMLRDIMLYLDTFTTVDKILAFLDGDTIGCLKAELAVEYNRKLIKNDLWKTRRI